MPRKMHFLNPSEMLDKILAWRIGWPEENLVSVMLKEVTCDFGSGRGVVNLLKNHLLWIDTVVLLGECNTLV